MEEVLELMLLLPIMVIGFIAVDGLFGLFDWLAKQIRDAIGDL